MTPKDIEAKRKQFEDGLEAEIEDRLEMTREARDKKLTNDIEERLRTKFEDELGQLIEDESKSAGMCPRRRSDRGDRAGSASRARREDCR